MDVNNRIIIGGSDCGDLRIKIGYGIAFFICGRKSLGVIVHVSRIGFQEGAEINLGVGEGSGKLLYHQLVSITEIRNLAFLLCLWRGKASQLHTSQKIIGPHENNENIRRGAVIAPIFIQADDFSVPERKK